MSERTIERSPLRTASLWLAVACMLVSPQLVSGLLHGLHSLEVHASALVLCATDCHDPGHDHAGGLHHDCSQCAASRHHAASLLPDPIDLRGVPPLRIARARVAIARGRRAAHSPRPRAPPAAV